jgi:hypothetical protein
VDLYSAEHEADLDQMNNNIFGFWTNRLFNSPAPQTIIWANAYARLGAGLLQIQRRNVKRATLELLMTRTHYVAAQIRYEGWKDGIPNAGGTMQERIAATSIGVVLIAVGAFAATAAAAADTAATTAAAEQTVVRIGAVVERANVIMRSPMPRH